MPSPERPSFRLPLVLGALFVGWLLLSSVGGHGSPWPVVGAVAVALTAYAVGRSVPDAVSPGLTLVLGVGCLASVVLGEGPLSAPLSGPLGYANANAALATQGTAAFALATCRGPLWARALAAGGAVAGLALCLAIGAVAAAAGCLLIIGAALAASPVMRRVSVAASLVVVLGASSLAFVVGWSGGGTAVEATLSERRVQLWSDGVQAVRDDPVIGVGARAFPQASETARADADTREAHAELLQRTVENGVPGALLEMLVLAGVLWSLLPASDRASTVGIASVAALWANAGVDYVLAFPPVLAAAGLVAGLAAGPVPPLAGRRR